MIDHTCVFCRISTGDLASKKILETEMVLVILDAAPKAPVHYLIMPKQHKQTMQEVAENDVTLMQHMFAAVRNMAKKLEHPQAFTIISNNGQASGQTVPHLHWHFLAGKNLYQNGFFALKYAEMPSSIFYNTTR